MYNYLFKKKYLSKKSINDLNTYISPKTYTNQNKSLNFINYSYINLQISPAIYMLKILYLYIYN